MLTVLYRCIFYYENPSKAIFIQSKRYNLSRVNMEVVEVNTKSRPNQLTPPFPKSLECPCTVKCTKKYVQPPRLKSFAPERTYNPPSKTLETNTTYHLSYLNLDNAEMRRSRSQPVKPIPALVKPDGQFSDKTTNRLSYRQPPRNVSRTKPIIPSRQRSMIGSGRMEDVTTVRHDYARKHVEKPEIILPCGNIRLSSGKLDTVTTAKLSYVDPGPTEPVIAFKPIRVYCPPSELIHLNTTHKLSYPPIRIEKAESHPWQQKPIYKAPDVAMCGRTTYCESYLKNDEPCVEKPIRPTESNIILPQHDKFVGKSIYKESYLDSDNVKRVEPFLPRDNISRPNGKISIDTTSRMSYQLVQGQKRSPIVPPRVNMMGDGSMQTETTNRCDFAPKSIERNKLVIPCNNLRSSESPMDDRTTTKLSYVKPGAIECVQSFKPAAQYCRLPDKIDTETVSQLSYQPWALLPKEVVPWSVKSKYQSPTDPMCVDTIYRVSYPVPGHYQVCESENCDCQ